LDSEEVTFAKLVPGPFRWNMLSPLPTLLLGFSIDFGSMYCSALAAKGRV